MKTEKILRKFKKEGKILENEKTFCIIVENEEDLDNVLLLLDDWEKTDQVIDLSPYADYIRKLYDEWNKKNKS